MLVAAKQDAVVHRHLLCEAEPRVMAACTVAPAHELSRETRDVLSSVLNSERGTGCSADVNVKGKGCCAWQQLSSDLLAEGATAAAAVVAVLKQAR